MGRIEARSASLRPGSHVIWAQPAACATGTVGSEQINNMIFYVASAPGPGHCGPRRRPQVNYWVDKLLMRLLPVKNTEVGFITVSEHDTVSVAFLGRRLFSHLVLPHRTSHTIGLFLDISTSEAFTSSTLALGREIFARYGHVDEGFVNLDKLTSEEWSVGFLGRNMAVCRTLLSLPCYVSRNRAYLTMFNEDESCSAEPTELQYMMSRLQSLSQNVFATPAPAIILPKALQFPASGLHSEALLDLFRGWHRDAITNL